MDIIWEYKTKCNTPFIKGKLTKWAKVLIVLSHLSNGAMPRKQLYKLVWGKEQKNSGASSEIFAVIKNNGWTRYNHKTRCIELTPLGREKGRELFQQMIKNNPTYKD